MCGIAGIITFEKKFPSDTQEIVSKMLDTLQHRGPNDRGIWNSPVVTLGHVRLSIIDLSQNAAQPMEDDSGRVIIFNGEIYNYLELKQELKGGYTFKSHSDTEVILAAYEKWGLNCVRHFNGDWAFALYDKPNRRLFLSRDRFGVKPLYYYRFQNKLVFASEIKTLLAAGVPRKVRRQRLAEFIRYRRNETPFDSLVEGVVPVRPSHSIIIEENGTFHETEYYTRNDLLGASTPSNFDEASDMFGMLFEDSVKLRLRSDVPVGICLSGGLDSSAITAAATQYGQNKINTYSAVFPGYRADESYFSDAVATQCKSRHHRIELTLDDFFSVFEDFIKSQDCPHHSPRTIARYYVLKEAAKDVTVVLDGQGGDEIFGGYNKIYQIYQKYYEAKFDKKLLMHVQEQNKPRSKLPFLAELYQPFDEKSKKYRRLDQLNPSVEPYTDRQYVILRNNLLCLLHTEDRMTMRHSIEGRVPLLDHRLVEMCFSVPVHFKMQDYDKRMMRHWVKKNGFLPDSVIFRTEKRGFSTSFEETLPSHPKAIMWLQSMLSDYMAKKSTVFDPKAVFFLMDELKLEKIDNVNRLLVILSTLIYLYENKLEVVD